MTDRAVSGPPKHFIVIVPGYMGSLLRDKHTQETVWIDVPDLMTNPLKIDDMLQAMIYPNDNLEPYAIMERGVLYVLPWARLGHYGRLIEVLEKLGYQIEPNHPDPDKPAVYKFAYDWRQDNRISARQLGEAIQGWRRNHPDAEVWLIGHSNGGIVSRWYIENEGGKNAVARLFLMGSPWDGAPKSIQVMMDGLEVFGRLKLNMFGIGKRMKDVIRSFPSYYQLIPHTDPFLKNTQNQTLDPFADMRWLEGDQERRFLQDARQFYRDLDHKYSVETICFIGTKKRTTTSGVVKVGPGGTWDEIDWDETLAGDGTVPERSAIHPGVQTVYAYWVDHGNIYVDESMLAQLERELYGKYRKIERAALVTKRYSIVFEPDKVFYSPGETINLWATIQDLSPGKLPVSNAQVEVTLEWFDVLPGDKEIGAPSDLPKTNLWEEPETPGRYIGQFKAPLQEGYYTLRTVVDVAVGPPFTLEESIAIEQQD